MANKLNTLNKKVDKIESDCISVVTSVSLSCVSTPKRAAKVDILYDNGWCDSNNETANLVSGSNSLLSDHYSNDSLHYDLIIEAHMEEKENIHHGCKAGDGKVLLGSYISSNK